MLQKSIELTESDVSMCSEDFVTVADGHPLNVSAVVSPPVKKRSIEPDEETVANHMAEEYLDMTGGFSPEDAEVLFIILHTRITSM